MSLTKHGLMAKGKFELRKHEARQRLTYKEMVLAKCYECCAGYTDGKRDCEITGCPIYPKMPYRNVK